MLSPELMLKNGILATMALGGEGYTGLVLRLRMRMYWHIASKREKDIRIVLNMIAERSIKRNKAKKTRVNSLVIDIIRYAYQILDNSIFN